MRNIKNIYITGISGTLGTAFVELLHNDYAVTGIDRNETGIARLKNAYPDITLYCGDLEDADLAEQDLLIHLAAMKHIDLCETNASACIKNNVIKSYLLLKKAAARDCSILFMSTDKAVEPTSMYGFSKALIEGMVRELGGSFARSGNIIDSTGSVFSIWEQAIAKGQPLTITHPEMHRYFISPENLASRIWAQYKAGVTEITPEMDKDAKLIDLAHELLSSYGYYEWPIEYIGLRPGEKLREKLRWETV